jgi:tRNA 2-selenouridine synthase
MLRLDPARPVYIEAESRKIGQITLPDSLFARMHDSDCLQLQVALPERVRFLLEDYVLCQPTGKTGHATGFSQGRAFA